MVHDSNSAMAACQHMSVNRIHAALAKLCIAVFPLILLIAASGPTRAEQIRGLLVMGHEVRSLHPCGDERTLWVSVRGALRQQFVAFILDIYTDCVHNSGLNLNYRANISLHCNEQTESE